MNENVEKDALTYADGIEAAAGLAALYDTGAAAATALTVMARVARQVSVIPPASPERGAMSDCDGCGHHPEWVNKFDKTSTCNHPDCREE